MSSSTLPARFSAPAAASTSSATPPLVALTTSSAPRGGLGEGGQRDPRVVGLPGGARRVAHAVGLGAGQRGLRVAGADDDGVAELVEPAGEGLADRAGAEDCDVHGVLRSTRAVVRRQRPRGLTRLVRPPPGRSPAHRLGDPPGAVLAPASPRSALEDRASRRAAKPSQASRAAGTASSAARRSSGSRSVSTSSSRVQLPSARARSTAAHPGRQHPARGVQLLEVLLVDPRPAAAGATRQTGRRLRSSSRSRACAVDPADAEQLADAPRSVGDVGGRGPSSSAHQPDPGAGPGWLGEPAAELLGRADLERSRSVLTGHHLASRRGVARR